MMEKFAEDDRIEQMNAQKRRMKQLEHKRAVEQLIDDRRMQHQMERVSLVFLCRYINTRDAWKNTRDAWKNKRKVLVCHWNV